MAASPAADTASEEMAEVLGRFVDMLTEIHQILHISVFGKMFRSFGALACLVVAIVFSWKVLRAKPLPENQRRHQSQVPSSGQSDAGSQSSVFSIGEVRSSSVDSGAQDPTLGHLVRQKLCGGRKVTCQLLGVIFEETSPEELQKHATVKSSVREVLSEITKSCDLFLMERVLDDQSEERVLSALDDAGVFTSDYLVRDKVLFCNSENGRTSFVRQLEPDWHIDTNPDIIHQLARFIKYQLHISPNGHDRVASNVFSSTSLEQFFGASERS